MIKNILLFVMLLAGYTVSAQMSYDSTFVVKKGKELAINYSLKNQETVPMIARRFHVPLEKIESMSMVDGRKRLPMGTELFIPLLTENYVKSRQPQGIEFQQELYFKVGERDDLALIALYTGVKKQDLILWNNLRGNSLSEGQAVFIGWVKTVAKDSITLTNGLAYPKVKGKLNFDTAKKYTLMDSLYDFQTKNGTDVISEKGKAVFFEKAGKNDKFYAFHNTSHRGAILKVTNPGTGKSIMVQVLGPLPETKLYSNAVIGISNLAKDALGVVDNSVWCELTYAPN